MKVQRFNIGERVLYSRHGVTREAKVFGTELVEDPRRGSGWHYVLQPAPLELVTVHQDQMAPCSSS